MRAYRIEELLAPLVAAGGVTADQLETVQTDTHYTLAALAVPWVLTLPGDQQSSLSADAQHFVGLLEGWDYSTPSGLDGFVLNSATPAADQAVREASVATTFFSGLLRQLMHRLMADELEAHGFDGFPPWSHGTIATMLALKRAAEGSSTSLLFDDVSTDGVTETPQDVVVAALEGTVTALRGTAAFSGKDKSEWLWGYVHTLAPEPPLYSELTTMFSAPVYATSGAYDTVSPGSFGLPFSGVGGDFSYGSGPSMRIVHTVSSSGITSRFALPGGVAERTSDPHFQDLMMQTWLPHEYADFPGELAEVLAGKEKLLLLKKP